MSARPPVKEKHGSLHWVRNVLSRSIRLEQKRGSSTASAADRVGGDAVPLSLLLQQRAELGARLLVHDPATQVVSNLFRVHDHLIDAGWTGVASLTPAVLRDALAEAIHLNKDEESPLLETIVVHLGNLLSAADLRSNLEAKRLSEHEWALPESPEVSEGNYDEYELMERSWVGTVPAGLDLSRTAPGRL